MSTPVEQIKERLGIADVVGSYLKLERAGSSLKAKCPFHNEKTPSFFVSPARGSYYCFGCNAKGDIFTFVQEFEGLDFIGALRVLAQRAGVTLTKIDPKVQSEYARLYLCLEKATRFFEEQLQGNTEVTQYLLSRGLKEETVHSWRLGFAPNDWRQLLDHLQKEGFTLEEMQKVGLIKRAKAEDGSPKRAESFYDVFRGRVMFPIQDTAGRVIAFSGRILPALDDGKAGKYLNSPETVLFNKSATLYGFDKAKLVIREKDAAILVEGQMDLLMAHQAGYSHAVAASGTALTIEQLTRLKRLSENLLLSFDVDSAGLRASERGIKAALSLGMNVKVIEIGDGKDPAELILKNPGEWDVAVQGAKHIIVFLSDAYLKKGNPMEENMRHIKNVILPFIKLLPSSIDQVKFIRIISERGSLREGLEHALLEDLKKLPSPARGEETHILRKATPPINANLLERRVFGIYLFAEWRHHAPLLLRIRSALHNIFGQELFNKKVKAHESLRDVLLLEAEALYGGGAPHVKEEQELLRHLEEEHITALLSEAMDALAKAEKGGSKEEAQKLLVRCKELTQKLGTLKSARFLEPNMT